MLALALHDLFTLAVAHGGFEGERNVVQSDTPEAQYTVSSQRATSIGMLDYGS